MKNIIPRSLSMAFCMLMMSTFLIAKSKNPKKTISRTSNLTVAEFSGNLEYDFSRSSIRSVYYGKLNKLAQYLIDNKSALTLRGYADSIGSFKGNWKLSEKRAAVVKGYLVKKGVNEEKIITTAFGSTAPLTTNQTAQGRQRNRRVEIKINPVS